MKSGHRWTEWRPCNMKIYSLYKIRRQIGLNVVRELFAIWKNWSMWTLSILLCELYTVSKHYRRRLRKTSTGTVQNEHQYYILRRWLLSIFYSMSIERIHIDWKRSRFIFFFLFWIFSWKCKLRTGFRLIFLITMFFFLSQQPVAITFQKIHFRRKTLWEQSLAEPLTKPNV